MTCGGGIRVRTRNCTGPFHGGQPCVGPARAEQSCNIEPCAGTSTLLCHCSANLLTIIYVKTVFLNTLVMMPIVSDAENSKNQRITHANTHTPFTQTPTTTTHMGAIFDSRKYGPCVRLSKIAPVLY